MINSAGNLVIFKSENKKTFGCFLTVDCCAGVVIALCDCCCCCCCIYLLGSSRVENDTEKKLDREKPTQRKVYEL